MTLLISLSTCLSKSLEYRCIKGVFQRPPFGVPLNRKGKRLGLFKLDRLDQSVFSVRDRCQPWRQRVYALAMQRVHPRARSACPSLQSRALFQPNHMRCVVLLSKGAAFVFTMVQVTGLVLDTLVQ